MDGSQPLVTPDGDPPFEDEPADAPQDGQRPALTAVPSVPVQAGERAEEPPQERAGEPPQDAPPESDGTAPSGTPGDGADPGPGVSATFREIERRASAEIQRIAAESRREIAALRKEFAPPEPVVGVPDRDRSARRSRFRRGGGLRKGREVSPADGWLPARGDGWPSARVDDVWVRDRWATRPPRRPGPVTLVLVAVGVVLLCVGTAYVVGARLQPTLYGAQATFLLTPQPELSDTAVDHLTETQLLVVTSSQVLQPVASHSHVPLATLEREVSADMDGHSYVLVITVADGDQQRAVSLADGVARQYAVVAPTLTGASPQTRPVDVKVLTSAAALDGPLEPRPLRTLAAGLLVGILAALVVVVVLRRPWRTARQQPYWT